MARVSLISTDFIRSMYIKFMSMQHTINAYVLITVNNFHIVITAQIVHRENVSGILVNLPVKLLYNVSVILHGLSD